ncbi:hypothetical protein K1X76_05900 [bacterium]|nr:hypothetical protein [bacterium]
MKHFKTGVLVFTLFTAVACTKSSDIFPDVPVDVTADDFEIPNPIAIINDTVNTQLIVVNSNVDFFFDGGSITTFDVDGTDPDNPVLTPTAALATANYAGNVVFDGASLYVPFREHAEDDEESDRLAKYTIGSASITLDTETTTAKNPFGIALSAGGLLTVVCDNELDIYNTSLEIQNTVDLTTADDAGLADATALYVENVAIDDANNRAYITNRSDRMFVVSLDTNAITHVIDGPENSRFIVNDGSNFYVTDGNDASLWILDPTLLPAAADPVEVVDDSEVFVDVMDLGAAPNGILVDTATNRIYATNSNDKTLSVFDLTTHNELARISLDEDDTDLDDVRFPLALATGTFDGTDYIFVSGFETNNIAVIRSDTLKLVAVYE